ncbi:unnamed protein product [Rhizophagus irregularis]|nr:unnamed protein product [Rhizophagus irregularis]
MKMCLVSAKNKPSSDKGHVQEPQLHFYLHQQVLSTIENTDASPVATIERSTSYRKLEKRKTQIACLIAKQRKAPPSPSYGQHHQVIALYVKSSPCLGHA